MRNKTLAIILVILIVILVLWSLLFKPHQVQVVAPAANTTTNSSVTAPTPNSSQPVQSVHGIPPVVQTNTIYLNGGQHPATTVLNVGQKVIVNAADPISAGYVIDPLQYDAGVIGLVSHTHSNAGQNGTETWEFVALKTGTTGVTITASQPTSQNSTVFLFTNVMSVK